jgi:guanylate kinase
MKELENIMAEGRLPILDVEDLSIVDQFRAKNIKCLSIFLRPPSIDAYESRVRDWLTESDHVAASYVVQARGQMRTVMNAGFYDVVISNKELSTAVEDMVEASRSFRPDLFKDVSTGAHPVSYVTYTRTTI